MKQEMKPRERVLTVLELKKPDRVSIDFAQAGDDSIISVIVWADPKGRY